MENNGSKLLETIWINLLNTLNIKQSLRLILHFVPSGTILVFDKNMLRTILLPIVFLFSILCYAQENNALPPGPSTVSGKVMDENGNPIAKAKVTVLYADSVQRDADNFYTNEWGYFTAYVFRYNQKYIDIQIKVSDKVCKTIRYNNPGMGKNLEMGQREFTCN